MTKQRWPVIDPHYHIGFNKLTTFDAEKELIPAMDRAGTDIQIVFQVNEGYQHRTPDYNPYIGNDYLAKIQHMFPDRVLGLATVDPWLHRPKTYDWPASKAGKPLDLPIHDESLAEVERCILELGLWGLKLVPGQHNYEVNNPRVVFPLLETLSNMQKKCGRRMLVMVHGGGDSVNNTPTQVADAARAFPDIIFMMAHAGYIWNYGTASAVSIPYPNLLLELALCVEPEIVREAYQACGAGKIIIGTDGPFDLSSVKPDVVRYLTGDNEEDYQLIMGGNLAKLLGFPKITIEE